MRKIKEAKNCILQNVEDPFIISFLNNNFYDSQKSTLCLPM